MIPVDQTCFRGPDAAEGEAPGNCFAACIASLLECSLDEVPQPTAEDREDWADYWTRVAEFLRLRGFHMVDGKAKAFWSTESALDTPFSGYWIASGPSPRGPWNHSIVVRGADMAHDPHPSRAGLALENGIQQWRTASYLVPLDPARFVQPAGAAP